MSNIKLTWFFPIPLLWCLHICGRWSLGEFDEFKEQHELSLQQHEKGAKLAKEQQQAANTAADRVCVCMC